VIDPQFFEERLKFEKYLCGRRPDGAIHVCIRLVQDWKESYC
jgi:hypothetical protein